MFKNIKSLVLFCLLMSSCYCQTINVVAAQMLIKQPSFTEFATDIKKLTKQAKIKVLRFLFS